MARFDPVTERIETFRHDIRDTTTISDDFVDGIVIRSREPGVVWVATGGSGLNRLDVATREFRLFDESDGLANNSLYAILEDETGQLWLSSNRGLARFNPETETFRNYGLEIGLQALEFNLKAAHRSQAGELFFGGINGMNSFYPSQFVENSTPPQVALVDLRIHNQSVGTSNANRLNVPLQATDQLVLDYTEKDLTFDFAALHFENPEKNEFAYKLEGYDDDWVMTGHNRTAAFTNLDPGEYTFRVRAANSDGVWNEEGTSMRVTITPPFWATWWFRVFAALGLTSLLYVGYSARVRQIAERNRILEDEVSR